MRTQVAIVGAGPAGLLLSKLLHNAGIDSVVLEKHDRAYVESRIRAGVLERGSVDILAQAGVGERMLREGLPHDGISLAVEGETFRIDLKELTGYQILVYGQTEITKDLIADAMAHGRSPVFEARDVAVHGFESDAPSVTYLKDGQAKTLQCEFIAGCDGGHGVCLASIPKNAIRSFEQVYPFGWLGILADVPPCNDELIYASHARGFALASMRSQARSRYYVQVSLEEKLEAWSDQRLWDEIAERLGPSIAKSVKRGPAIEKSIAPLRSLVVEPLRHGRLFLAGDAAHIVPPTGAKGLNLAFADVHFLSDALIDFYRKGENAALDGYSSRALARIWRAERFSWWFTKLMHRFPQMTDFERKMQIAELEYVRSSRAAQTTLAENYVGLRLD